MFSLTEEELGLLEKLEHRDQKISGNRNRDGLARLIKTGYVIETATNMSDTHYTITGAGRTALRDALSKRTNS